jgi:hypothetical protein
MGDKEAETERNRDGRERPQATAVDHYFTFSDKQLTDACRFLMQPPER